MNERDFVMTDQVWQRLAPHLLGKTSAQKPQRAVPDPRWAHLNTKAERTDCQNTKISMACKITTAPFCGEGRAPPGLRPRESCALLRSLGKASDAGGPRQRIIVCFWKPFSGGVRTGAPRHDLPPAFGNWNSPFRRFRRWATAGLFEALSNAMSGDPELECELIDGTIVQVHQKATGAKGGLRLSPSGAGAAA